MNRSNRYADLPARFFQPVAPTPVRAPELLLWNEPLATELGIDKALGQDPARWARVFAGNEPLGNATPIATAYAGHQFGHFVPQLGDGRAHLIGELIDQAGRPREIQLKGSGPTAFSRGGDGRCALGPAIREYLMSEALHALGIPTTRSLAVVATGEAVLRQDGPEPGAVVTRVASSHLRVGTFQYFFARQDHEALQTLADYAIARHYPELADHHGAERYLALLDAVIARQIALVVDWMRVGFIHGVMNTDNTTISGETIDFGPCAMLSAYDPATVFSSIDHGGRYAFGNQPAIIGWNMMRLAECLLPLIDHDERTAIERATLHIEDFPTRFETSWQAMMRGKLGLLSSAADDGELIAALLDRMQAEQLDYTVTFAELGRSLSNAPLAGTLAALSDWVTRWHQRLAQQQAPAEQVQALMRQHNPLVIPRNHHIEATIADCVSSGAPTAAQRILEVLHRPYEQRPETEHYQDPPADNDRNYRTFCGT